MSRIVQKHRSARIAPIHDQEFVFRRLHLSDPEQHVEGIRGAELTPCQLSGRPLPSKLFRTALPSGCLEIANPGSEMLFTGQMPRGSHALVFVVTCPTKGRAFKFEIDHEDGYLGVYPPDGEIDGSTPEKLGTRP